MPKTHRPYPPEFRRQMVELVRTGRSPGSLSREFEPSAQSIRNWVYRAELELVGSYARAPSYTEELRRQARATAEAIRERFPR